MRNFEQRLTGGHPNSLGNTVEVVEEVLANSALFDELFQCYFSEDEVVRLRTSSAMKRICKEQPDILLPYIERLLTEIAQINQASTQWTLANLFDMLSEKLTREQKAAAQEIMKRNVAEHTDWIVLINSMETLGKWAQEDEALKNWILPHLRRLAQDTRKSVKGRAIKVLKKLE